MKESTARTAFQHTIRRVRPAVLATLLLASSLPARAGPPDMSWFVQVGDGDRAIKSATVGVTRGFQPFGLSDASAWSLYAEALVGEWFIHDRDEGARGRFTQFGITPVVRYSLAGGAFVEAGIGLDVIAPRFRDGDRTFSTKFNFGDHVAIGHRFGAAREHELTLRAEHFSNGGIRHPNPGQNFFELRYARHF